MALYELFSVSLIPVYHHRIWCFVAIGGVKMGGGGGGMFLKKRGISRRGMKKEMGGGADTPLRNISYEMLLFLYRDTYLSILF